LIFEAAVATGLAAYLALPTIKKSQYLVLLADLDAAQLALVLQSKIRDVE
jgi:hypothetical protein